MVKKIMALVLALSFGSLLAVVPNANAKGGEPEPCQIEDGGVCVPDLD